MLGSSFSANNNDFAAPEFVKRRKKPRAKPCREQTSADIRGTREQLVNSRPSIVGPCGARNPPCPGIHEENWNRRRDEKASDLRDDNLSALGSVLRERGKKAELGSQESESSHETV